jgi:DNA-directed RNA polymerase specialized sigma24 family protein
MDTLTQSVRDALIAEGASPATADMLAVDFVYRARNRLVRDKREMDAMQALPLGHMEAAEKCGCHPATVYRRAERARRKYSRFLQPTATSPQ